MLEEFKTKAAAAALKRRFAAPAPAAAAGAAFGKLRVAATATSTSTNSRRGWVTGVTSVTGGVVTSDSGRGRRTVLPAAALTALLLQLAKVTPEGAAAMAGEREEIRGFIAEVGGVRVLGFAVDRAGEGRKGWTGVGGVGCIAKVPGQGRTGVGTE